MIIIKNKHDCCGCNACQQNCPKQCIDMVCDNEGFKYPRVNIDLCIKCNKCIKVCPIINHCQPRTPINTYAAINPSREIRLQSSSGGLFFKIASYVISKNGVVFGAVWNKTWEVEHSFATTVKELKPMMGSKYVQSSINQSYISAEEFLKQGKTVLFTGTPCQIRGLKNYLTKYYERLITVDFVCHGVPSPSVFNRYLNEELEQYSIDKGVERQNVNIEDIRFRDKISGWKNFSLSIAIKDKRTQSIDIISSSLSENPFLRGFLNDLYLRPSCYNCKFKNFSSGSDITIADYWGYQLAYDKYKQENPQIMLEIIDDDKGISAVMINTHKGSSIFENIKCQRIKTRLEDVKRMNGAIWHSASCAYRQYFFSLKRLSFFNTINFILSSNILSKIARKAYILTHKTNMNRVQ